MIRHFYKISILALLITVLGCYKDLDTIPLDPDLITSAVVYDSPGAYRGVLAKIYAGLAITGQQGPAGAGDISSIDEGFGQYLRMYWYHQELTTEEAIVGWNDQTIKDFHDQTWTPADGFVYACYFRINYQIALANEFLRETTSAKLDSRGVEDAIRAEIQDYRAEARLLRALSYWHGLDLFRNIPFVQEDYVIGSPPPKQGNTEQIFNFIESELKELEGLLKAPRTNEYGRVDRAAAWMILAKLYLNAEVYLETNRAEDCLTYCEKIINANYELEPVYNHLFLADNHTSNEIIFPITFDGNHTRTWGGMTFIINAAIGGSMDPLESGVTGGWGGLRTTKEMVEKFPVGAGGTPVEFNPGQSASYLPFYLPNSTQGFDALETSNKLTSPNSDKIYEGYRYFETGDEFRFAQYPDNSLWWGDNGANGMMNIGGANIVIPETGLYHIVMNFNDKTYSIEKQELSITGTATGGAVIDLSYDNETGYMTTSTPLSLGTLRILINGDPTRYFGDTNADALLSLGGDDIQIGVEDLFEINVNLIHPDYTYELNLNSFDRRPNFFTDGQNLEINNVTEFTDGYAIRKFKNITKDGQMGSNATHPDTDFPLFRLADAYLMASEAVLRGAAGGDKQKAVDYLNKVRERAWNGSANNATTANIDLPMLLDERARELYWEGHRRTDLVRFGQFTDGDYLWAWKGGVKEGKKVEPYRNIFPIPSSDLIANPNLEQNEGY